MAAEIPEGFVSSPFEKKWTPPFDARYPNVNQTKNCWQNYLDFHRCQNIKGEDFEGCQYFKKVFKAICPSQWTEKWDEWREEGIFPGRLK